MNCSATKVYEIGEFEYEVEISDFHPGSPGSYWEPPDGGEVVPDNIIVVTKGKDTDGEVIIIGKVTWDVFLLYYASDNGLTLDKAEDLIIDDLFQAAADWYYDLCQDEDRYERYDC